MRLQKFLSAAGVCSRRKGERLIREGRVSVNGEPATELGIRVQPRKDRVCLDGRPVIFEPEMLYIALNKPAGYVTSCRHPGQRIVLELVDIPRRVYPVGRLDRESTGLLLLTNDGRLHHRLSHPSFDHEKEYAVTVARPISRAALEKLAAGIVLEGRRTRPARVIRVSARRFRIVLQEGRNRQIRRMVGRLGHQVTRLERRRIANIKLGRLPPGKWRYLRPSEKEELLKLIKS